MISFPDELLARIEAYRQAHDLPSEAEAIRVLVEQALAAAKPKAKRTK